MRQLQQGVRTQGTPAQTHDVAFGPEELQMRGVRQELLASRQPAETQEDARQTEQLHVRDMPEAVRDEALLHRAQNNARRKVPGRVLGFDQDLDFSTNCEFRFFRFFRFFR